MPAVGSSPLQQKHSALSQERNHSAASLPPPCRVARRHREGVRGRSVCSSSLARFKFITARPLRESAVLCLFHAVIFGEESGRQDYFTRGAWENNPPFLLWTVQVIVWWITRLDDGGNASRGLLVGDAIVLEFALVHPAGLGSA